MKRVLTILVVTACLALGGCTTHLERDVNAEAIALCAAKGKQFVSAKLEQTESLLAKKATLTGQCVGPGEPGYVTPTPSNSS